MKKILLLILISISVASSVEAQLQKGNVLVGTDIANLSFDLNTPTSVDLNIRPSAAWFVNDNVAIGARVMLHPTFFSDGLGTNFRYSVDALGRYYINDPKVNMLRHGRWYFEGLAGIGGQNYSEKGISTNGLDLGFGPGYAYFITPTVGLETSLEYDVVVGFGSVSTQSTLALNVGFQIYLPGRSTMNKVKHDMQ